MITSGSLLMNFLELKIIIIILWTIKNPWLLDSPRKMVKGYINQTTLRIPFQHFRFKIPQSKEELKTKCVSSIVSPLNNIQVGDDTRATDTHNTRSSKSPKDAKMKNPRWVQIKRMI
jgi:hypothetical protein